MAFPTLKQAAGIIRTRRPYGKVCAAYLEGGTLEAAAKADGLMLVEAKRQLIDSLPQLLRYALNQNVAPPPKAARE